MGESNRGRLTTHVLDTAHGRPAAGVVIRLSRNDGDRRDAVGEFVTNADGRVDAPLLQGASFAVGRYELEFAVGDYFAGLGVAMAEPRFLDVVSLRFGISDADAHYHVPLLVSPYAFSSYRGS